MILLMALAWSMSADRVFFLVGDSTMTNYGEHKFPMTGWGQVFNEHVKSDVKVKNLAVGGRSTKSFRDEGRWDSMLNELTANDVVIIQFGHNDQKKNLVEQYADANSDYQTNLKRFIDEVRAKGGEVIICTPVNRRTFDKGAFRNSLGGYPAGARKVAKESGVPLIDLNEFTEELFIKLGDEESKKLFTFGKAGEFSGYPAGIEDNSHFNKNGATVVSDEVARVIKERKLPGSSWLK